MNRSLRWLIALVLLAGLFWMFPLFHVVSLEHAVKEKEAATFNASRFAEKLWDEQLPGTFQRAVKAGVLLPAIRDDAGEARKKYSRGIGISESYTYLVSGQGRVLGISEDAISLGITDGATQPEIMLQTGLLFGNAVRDGSGWLNVNDYPNSQDFNDISAALNHLVETRVLPKLREQAKVGSLIRFAGCAEIADESADLRPLRVVPIQAEVQ